MESSMSPRESNFALACRAARIVRNNYSPGGGAVELNKILAGEKLNLFYNTNPDSTPSAYIDPRNRAIYLRRSDQRHRQRFSIAHELGHWFLHDHNKTHDRKETSGTPEENEANAFAIELLAPVEEVKVLLSNYVDTSDIARYFDISFQAAYYRCLNIQNIFDDFC